jgi:FAD:protein FMN transferase
MSRNNRSPAPTPPDLLHVPAGMARSHFRAMGTTISLLVPAEDLKRAEEMVRALFFDWEQALSRFVAESGLSRLNRMAGSPVIVEALLFAVMDRALAAARATDGLYDPTLLNQLQQLGYDRAFDALLAERPATGYQATPGGRWCDIHINSALRLVTLPAGVGVDFGGIAKGMAVDAALEQLRQHGLPMALVNAGGDLAVLGLPALERQWPIEVEGKTRSWVIPFQRGALATSGVSRRHWRQGGHERHHLLDPRTGLPAQSGLWSVTVAADSCEQAEVAAKVAFLLGEAQGGEFLRRHDLSGLLVQDDGSWSATGSWPKEALLQ